MFWLIGSSSEVSAQTLALLDRKPPALVVEDARTASPHALLERLQRRMQQPASDLAGTSQPVDSASYRPKILTITDATFAPDFFVHGAWFVSARLRRAIGSADGCVQYLAVDATACHAAARQQDYRVMHPFAVRDVIDPDRSEVVYRTVPAADGSRGRQVSHVARVVWRREAAVDVPIFRDPRDQRFFATDALAERLLRAGITGMAFQDITSERAQSELVLKAL
jgi:hypothetical protein